jgi:cell wall-associated NlpC family hydrolase
MLSLTALPRRVSVPSRPAAPVPTPVHRRLVRLWVRLLLAVVLPAALFGTVLTPAQPAAAAATAARGAAVARLALRYVGYRYVWGGASPRGFDCSGLVMYVYGRVGVRLPHSQRVQFSSRYGTIIRSMAALRTGDIVYFRNTNGPGLTHAAIYVGNGRIVSANNPRQGVRLENLHARYWTAHYAGGMRPY